MTKLCAPYFIHKIPYHVRIIVFVALSACGMLVVALAPQAQDARAIGIKLSGVLLASLSSGGGELSFLGLTHYYGHFALAAWGSGTGGAGLVGAGAYAVFTTTLGISPRTSLLVFSFLPVFMLISFFAVLPRGPLLSASGKRGEYETIADDEVEDEDIDDLNERRAEGEGLLAASMHSTSGRSFSSVGRRSVKSSFDGFKANLRRARGLFFP